MEIQKLIYAASKQPHIYLTRKVGSKLPRGFPRGELMCVNSDGEQCWLFDSAKILKWCHKQKE